MPTKTLLQSLLTEDRYWTFWSSDWRIRVNVFWGGKTKWAQVKKAVSDKYFAKGKIEHGYERQIQIREPNISFK